MFTAVCGPSTTVGALLRSVKLDPSTVRAFYSNNRLLPKTVLRRAPAVQRREESGEELYIEIERN